MNSKKIDVSYYENNDLSEIMKQTRTAKKVVKTRRVTMNIPLSTYVEANNLDKSAGMGYQNVLKMAMVIGLHTLQNQIGLVDNVSVKKKTQ